MTLTTVGKGNEDGQGLPGKWEEHVEFSSKVGDGDVGGVGLSR